MPIKQLRTPNSRATRSKNGASRGPNFCVALSFESITYVKHTARTPWPNAAGHPIGDQSLTHRFFRASANANPCVKNSLDSISYVAHTARPPKPRFHHHQRHSRRPARDWETRHDRRKGKNTKRTDGTHANDERTTTNDER